MADGERSEQWDSISDAVTDSVQMWKKGHSLQETRGDLVTARQTVRRAIAGDDANLEAAASLIDQALVPLYPHDREKWFHPTGDSGEMLITCPACGVSWFTGERV